MISFRVGTDQYTYVKKFHGNPQGWNVTLTEFLEACVAGKRLSQFKEDQRQHTL